MQDPSIYSQIKPQFPEQEQLKCPRCDSINTKFCYYNNYNLSQPRHFCKNCRRYWTKGGTLRNIPVGGGSRKNTKRPSSSKKVAPTTSCSVSPVTSSSSVDPKIEPFVVPPTTPGFDQTSRVIGLGNGPFSSLLASNMPQFGNLLEALNTNHSSGPGPSPDPGPSLGPDADAYVGLRSCGDSNSLKFGRNLDSDSGLVLGPGSDSGTRDGGANSGCWKISRSPKSVSGLGTGSGLDSDNWKIPINPNSVSGLGTDSGLESNHENGNTTYLGVKNGGGDFNHPKQSKSPNAISGLGTGSGSDQSGNNTYLDDSNCWNGSNGNWPDLAI